MNALYLCDCSELQKPMKIIAFLLLFISLNCLGQISILKDTSVSVNKTTKFVFERFNKTSTKKIPMGKGVTINLTIGDTTVTAFGLLIDVDTETITINPVWKVKSIKRNNFKCTENLDYHNSLMTFDLNNVKSIKYNPSFILFLSALGVTSIGSALIASPIIAIDKNSQNNFNVNRYKTVVFSSLASTVFFLTVTIISDNRKDAYKLKPKLIEKIEK
jgi:hypothetical protein